LPDALLVNEARFAEHVPVVAEKSKADAQLLRQLRPAHRAVLGDHIDTLRRGELTLPAFGGHRQNQCNGCRCAASKVKSMLDHPKRRPELTRARVTSPIRARNEIHP
jgi:hypothetical protein